MGTCTPRNTKNEAVYTPVQRRSLVLEKENSVVTCGTRDSFSSSKEINENAGKVVLVRKPSKPVDPGLIQRWKDPSFTG